METNECVKTPRLTIYAVGSAESTHVIDRVKCLVERGHHAYLICSRLSDIEGVQEIVPQLPPSRVIEIPLKLVNAFSVRVFKKSIAPYLDTVHLFYNHLKILRRQKPDIVHVHYAYSMLAWMAAVADHHPLVVSIMGGDILFDEQGSATPRGKWLTLQLLNSADLITSKSDYLTSVLEKLGKFGSKTIRVIWGVDLARFRAVDATALRTHLGLSSCHRVIE